MSEMTTVVFESTETTLVRAVERSLALAGLPFERRFERPSLVEHGIKKKPARLLVAPADELRARELVEEAVLRRDRIVSLQPKPTRAGADLSDGGGSIDLGFDFGGGHDGGCHGGGHCH